MAKSSFAFVEDTFEVFRSRDLLVKPAVEPWEKTAYFSLRKQVFHREQKILPENETDAQDFRAIPIVAVASTWGVQDTIVGAVRIYQVDDCTWFGGRLCVDRRYRGIPYIGKALINEAVSRAKDMGCRQFYANVQLQNEKYFQRLYWKSIENIELEDRPHVRMEAMLENYPYMKRYNP